MLTPKTRIRRLVREIERDIKRHRAERAEFEAQSARLRGQYRELTEKLSSILDAADPGSEGQAA